MLFNCFFPHLPTWNTKPPTLYSIMNSIVNFDKEEKTKIKDLYSTARETIFNFNYPLSSYVNKEQFEKMILNKFLMRRIGFETVTAFRIALDVKLNEIMPLYNKMFDALENWDLFNDGERISENGLDNRTSNNINNTTNTNSGNTNSNTQNTLENTSNTNSTNKRKYSNTPQGLLNNLEDNNYVTDYTIDENVSSDKSNSSGNSKNLTETNNKTEINIKNDTTDINNYNKTITRTPADKIKLYTELQQNVNNIYTLIFKDLECLFYQII